MSVRPAEHTLSGEMDFKCFAEKYRLRIKRDGCGDPIIPGKQFADELPDRPEYRSHLYQHLDGIHLGVALLFNSARKARSAQRQLAAAGFLLRQIGDIELTALFDSTNPEHVRLALKLAGIKKRRVPSPAQLEVIRKMQQTVAA